MVMNVALFTDSAMDVKKCNEVRVMRCVIEQINGDDLHATFFIESKQNLEEGKRKWANINQKPNLDLSSKCFKFCFITDIGTQSQRPP